MTYSFAINGLSSTRNRIDDAAVVKANSDTGTEAIIRVNPGRTARIPVLFPFQFIF